MQQASNLDPEPSSRVLVVDDEAELRETIGRGLSRSGYDVALAGNGAEALNKLATGPDIDAVVTDIEMPVMSGPDLAVQVLDHHPGVPILFVSSRRAPDHLLQHPLVDWLTKPPSIRALCTRVRTLLETVTKPTQR